MESAVESPFRLGPWQVEPRLHRLHQDGEVRHLTPKAMDVLLHLSRQAGQVVSRESLLDAVWPDTHISDEVVTRAISDLRAALGDDRRAPRFIETIPKVGYRLLLQPEEAQPELPQAERSTAAESRLAWHGGPWLLAAALIIAVSTPLVLQRGQSRAERPATRGAAPRAAAPLSAAPLTAYAGFETHAEASPDGSRVAFSWQGDSSQSHLSDDRGNTDIYILPADAAGSTPPQRLTTHPAPDLGATWSPDGRRLAFLRYTDEADVAEERCTILEVSLAGGGNVERRLGSCGANVTADLAWSPDGQWLAFSDRERNDEPYGIFLLSTVDGRRRKLVAPDGQHWGDSNPSFSPDGLQLAFTRGVSMDTQDIFRIALAGGPEVPITRDGRAIRGHVWLPDGSGLVVSSRRTGARGLWTFPLDPTAEAGPSWIPLAVDHAWRPTLGRRGGPLLFERRVVEAGIQRWTPGASIEGASIEGTSVEAQSIEATWTPRPCEDLDPHVSPDGHRLAFSSNCSGHFEIWLAAADGNTSSSYRLTQLTALHGAYNGSPRWSPDGTALVFDARLDGQADIYRLRLDAVQDRQDEPAQPQHLERLSRDPDNDLQPSYSPDGKWIYFGSNRTGSWQIWRRPASTEEAQNHPSEQVTHEGGYMALAASDGDTLFLTRYGTAGLFRHTLSRGVTTAVAGTENLIGSAFWTLDGDTLTWLARGNDGIELWRQPADGVPEHLGQLGTPRLVPGLAVHPLDGSVLFASIQRLEADLWRVDDTPPWLARR